MRITDIITGVGIGVLIAGVAVTAAVVLALVLNSI
jgi:hypothetical protein